MDADHTRLLRLEFIGNAPVVTGEEKKETDELADLLEKVHVA